MQLFGKKLAVIFLGVWSSFPANFCPMFIAVLELEIQLVIDQLLPTHQSKVLGLNKLVKGFC